MRVVIAAVALIILALAMQAQQTTPSPVFSNDEPQWQPQWHQIPALDASPKEWTTQEDDMAVVWPGMAVPSPYPPHKHTVHHRTCEEKNRFLLMSEDGVWHCLILDFEVRISAEK